MSVETLGEALRAGWRVRAKCAHGKRDGLKSIRECLAAVELGLQTLVWTRGAPFPVGDLSARLRCPACRSLKVTVMFEPAPLGNTSAAPSGARNQPSQEAGEAEQMTVQQYDGHGRFDRILARSPNALVARGAFEAAIKHVTLPPGGKFVLAHGSRHLDEYPPRGRPMRETPAAAE